MRKVLCFIVASAMTGGGILLLAHQAIWNPLTGRYALGAGISLVALGGYWLWVDFIAPMFGFETES